MGLLQETLGRIQPPDEAVARAAKERLDQLTMPHWALGRLMDLAMELAAMTGSVRPVLNRKVIVVMAADHGVAVEGVSKYPQEVTVQMVANFVHGGAGINALARVSDTDLAVVDMGIAGDVDDLAEQGLIISKKIGRGTANIAVGPAMSRKDAIHSIEAGIEVGLMLADSTDVFGTGDMGIGNTTPSSAIIAAMTGAAPATVTGRGTGIDDHQFEQKVAVVERALLTNRPHESDAVDVLAKVGGFEIGGIAGLILAAAARRKPVLVDGLISSAGALIAHGLAPVAAGYMIAAHRSVEQGHGIALERLGKKPLLDLGMRLGEGTGAALAMALVDAAVRVLTEVATFEEASVSKADK